MANSQETTMYNDERLMKSYDAMPPTRFRLQNNDDLVVIEDTRLKKHLNGSKGQSESKLDGVVPALVAVKSAPK